MPFPDRNSFFAQGWNVKPNHSGECIIDPGSQISVLDNAVLAYDTTQATAVTDHIGDRACINCTNSGSTATDIVNAQSPNCFQVLAGKELLMRGSFRMTTTTQEFALGVWATDTNYWSTLPTDYIVLEKATGVTQFVIKCRKASGTAQSSASIGPVLVADTWYDWAVRVIGDPTTAGKGIVQVALGSGVTAGGLIPVVYNETFGTQVPDTVDLGPGFSWRAGSAANVSGFIGLTGFSLQQPS
jgi:hypothetical protein